PEWPRGSCGLLSSEEPVESLRKPRLLSSDGCGKHPISRVTEAEVTARLGSARVVPVLSVSDVDRAEAAARALLRGGLTSVEITFRTEVAAEAIRRVSAIEGLLVGAGTVLSAGQAELALAAGARFAVAPGTNVSVVAACQALGLPFFPGV